MDQDYRPVTSSVTVVSFVELRPDHDFEPPRFDDALHVAVDERELVGAELEGHRLRFPGASVTRSNPRSCFTGVVTELTTS